MAGRSSRLSLKKQLYIILGAVSFLILVELVMLSVVADTLSAIRALTYGESLWVKAHKNAIHHLHMYALTSDKSHYASFHTYLRIPEGDRIGRAEIFKENPNFEKAKLAFIQGGNHPDDVGPGIRLLTRFSDVSQMKEVLSIWDEGDLAIDELRAVGREIDSFINKGMPVPVALFHDINNINQKLNVIEKRFAESLSSGARQVESLMVGLLSIVVICVGVFGTLVLFLFGRRLIFSLKELANTAHEIGRGNFDRQALVFSKDEIGDLGIALRKMAVNLKKSIDKISSAQSASATKTLFLANMSHEIRTPLGVILGFAEVLKDKGLSEEDKDKYLGLIETTGHRLSRIINDILDLSKVEAGHLELELKPYAVKEMVQEVCELLQDKAQAKNLELTCRMRGAVPEYVLTDKVRIHQILINLIGNALKFTEKGRVELICEWNKPFLRFRVSDTGIGLTPDQQKTLFKVFSQADESTTRKFGGTGLGLVLSQKLAQAMGGDAILEKSEPGKGTSFLVSLRAEVVQDKVTTKTSDSDCNAEDLRELEGSSVLVVDDSPDNQLIVRHFLKSCKVSVAFAANGKEAVEVVRKQKFDYILMDMQMPVMDGYTATENIREMGIQVPIIAFTAHAMKEDRERCIRSGCDDYVSKPVTADGLLAVLKKYSKKNSSSLEVVNASQLHNLGEFI